MAMQHTPGPWSYDPEINRVFSLADDTCVATPHIATNPTVMARWPADARLIAAAPDMLTSLRAMLALYDFDDELPADHPVVTARAAIAKAESP